MKKLLLAFVLCMATSLAYSQTQENSKGKFPADQDMQFDKGSNVNIPYLSKIQIGHIKAMGLIWGFLKYYHPSVAKGNYNWDYELFRILPSILAAENNLKRDELITAWINGLGEFSTEKKSLPKSADIKMLPDLEWINTSGFSEPLTALLTKIKDAERPKKHYYIDLYPGVGNPNFLNEKPYADMQYSDVGFRLLALYRYWNIIQYYYPYKYLIKGNWQDVLEEFIPKIADANNELSYTLALLELIGRINDTHANVWGGNQTLLNYFGRNNTPVELTFIDDKAVVTGFHNEALGKATELAIGDMITRINGAPVEELVKHLMRYAPASNYPTKLRDIAPKLMRTNDTLMHVEYLRDQKIQNTVIKAYSEDALKLRGKFLTTDTCFKMITPEIAYLNNGSLKGAYLPALWEMIKDTKGLIIDDRNYPSDFPIYLLSNLLMPEGNSFVKFSTGNIQTPGLFTYTTSLNAGTKNKDYYKGKIVILINEITQSSAEFHAMAYRTHPNAVVIGSTTAGADGNVSRFFLPGNITTMITGIGVYYPDGKETQQVGIVPDIEIKPTIEGIKEGRDELMEKALELINNQ